ncbi:MAG: Hpt domain-containing protein, partial [Lachnospiraceae bacterium]|nr:Hpt domain-containing protein [Lachnospiraceae bacterium]
REDGNNPNCHTPAVCLTANAIAGARDKYLAAGFDDYLSKPIEPRQLEEMLLEYIAYDKIRFRSGEESEGTDGSMEEVPESFAALKNCSIDIDAGLKNSGTAESYVELLRIFREAMDEKTQELNRLYQENDLKNYTIKVHALKSSARIIGAAGFGEEAQLLENAGKTEDIAYIRSHHEPFMKEYQGFREPLSACLSEYEALSDKPEADPDLMQTVFDEVRDAAEDMDCERLDSIFAEMKQYSIPREQKELFDKTRDAVEKYEYGTILALLAQDGQQEEKRSI